MLPLMLNNKAVGKCFMVCGWGIGEGGGVYGCVWVKMFASMVGRQQKKKKITLAKMFKTVQ